MTFEEYNRKVDEFEKRMEEVYDEEEKFEEVKRQLDEFQNDYMQKVLEKYKGTIGGDKAKEVCYELLKYAVNESTSGNAIVDIDDEETAMKVDEILYEDLGDYLLDENENVYQEKDGQWVVDAMFGGAYIPGWDGWRELIGERVG